MKKTLVLLAAGMIPAMLLAVPFTLEPNAPWKKTADDAASIDYKGNKIWKSLVIKPAEALKPNTLYRITFEAKSTAAPTLVFCGVKAMIHGKKQEIYSKFYPTTDFQKYTVYFNSGETPEKGKPSIYFNPSDPFQLKVKNIKLDEMTDELLYGKNLLPEGDFEEGNEFNPYRKEMASFVKIVDDANFLSGEKSLLLDCEPGKVAQVKTGFVPAIPGKEVEVRFYAKSEDAARIRVQLDFWMQGSKHYYRAFKFKPEKEWKEYSLKLKISDDEEKYLALSRKLMCIDFQGSAIAKDGSAKIYIDNITCTIKK